jgi:acetyl/propionyl-CoA carboxylase alpha subunit
MATLRSGTLRVWTAPGSAVPDDPPLVVDPAALAPADDRRDARVGLVGASASGSAVVEVIVGGWRFELLVEPDRRARLRERATRGRQAAAEGVRLEVRAIIPGRVVSVAVAAGDPVSAGQELLVVEAMKMQNELRSPRDGIVERLDVAAGQTIELGDVLVVLARPEPGRGGDG